MSTQQGRSPVYNLRTNISSRTDDILDILCYYEVFRYPLRADEVLHFMSSSRGITLEYVTTILDSLIGLGLVHCIEGHYQLAPHDGRVERRRALNQRADEFLPLAQRMADFIGSFPFVRTVCVSGSLSKHCMAEEGDIDFFITTAPGRLWLARTLLVLFKKIFLFNSHKYFCINYFLDTEHLQVDVEEQNVFTATEVVTLLPMFGPSGYQDFKAANAWAWDHFPGYPLRALPTAGHPGASKRFWEWAFGGRVGGFLDRWSMRATVAYWRMKFRHFDDATFRRALRSEPHVSKHHPLQFQNRVLHAFQAERERIKEKLAALSNSDKASLEV